MWQSPLDALKLAIAGTPYALTKPRIVSALEHRLLPDGPQTQYTVDTRVPGQWYGFNIDLWLDTDTIANKTTEADVAMALASGTPLWAGTACISNGVGVADTYVKFSVQTSLLMAYAGALDALQNHPCEAVLFVVRVMLNLH